MFPPNQAPQQAPAQPEMAPGEEMQSGLRPVADIGFNQDVQNILLSRIQTLTPPEEQILDAVVNPQTVAVFVKILPELKPLFDMMSGAGGGQGSIAPGQQPQAPVQAQAPAVPEESAEGGYDEGGEGSDEGEDQGGEEEDEEEENPIVRNAPASRGLVG